MSGASELRRVGIFADLPDGDLDWLAFTGQMVALQPGDALFHQGDPANLMFAVVEGEMRGTQEKPPSDGRVYVIKAGRVSGMLPFSRMKEFPVTTRAVMPTRLLVLPAAAFPEMLRRIPVLESRLIGVMADRVRDTVHEDHKRETLMALGKLSAGLAHELNNPAAAAHRAASQMGERMARMPEIVVALLAARLEPQGHEAVTRLLAQAAEPAPPGSALQRADREDELTEWLNAHDVDDPERLATTFAERGLSIADLTELAATLPRAALPAALAWTEAVIGTRVLARDIETATGRISGLVAAVKSYSRMDQAPAKVAADIHESLETTLTVLAHKLRQKGVTLARRYAPDLPPVPAYAAELIQVWTNLIDNAADAVPPGGHIEVRTAREHDHVLVEVVDDGPGVPQEHLARIFEPFFTTKPVGQGTGLGLDIAQRIVTRRHEGEIRVDSRPGATRFQVRLPLTEVAKA